MTNWLRALKEIVGEANVIQDPDQLGAYAVDGLTPRAVVSPGSDGRSLEAAGLRQRGKTGRHAAGQRHQDGDRAASPESSMSSFRP